MPLLVNCPHCRARGHAPDDLQARTLACPSCGGQFDHPGASPSNAIDDYAVWVGPAAPAVTPPPRRGLAPDVAPGANRPPGGPEGAAVPVTADNAAAHLYWVQEEVRRFDAFVARQLEELRQQREALAERESQAAASYATRNMELNRLMIDLSARAAGLDRRESDLAGEVAKLDRRADALGAKEAAVGRRLAEVEELEDQLRDELEGRELEVERQRSAVEEALRDMRSRGAPLPTAGESATTGGHCCG